MSPTGRGGKRPVHRARAEGRPLESRHSPHAEDFLSSLEADKIDVLHVGIFDLDATFRERRLPRSQLVEALRGHYTFADVLHQWDTGETVHDQIQTVMDDRVELDLSTFRPFPFEPNAGLLIADYAGRMRERSPRWALKAQIEKAAEAGIAVKAALEFEFIVLDENAATLRDKGYKDLIPFARDNRCWSGQSAAIHAPFLAELEATLRSIDIDLFSLGTELGPGCFEATLAATDALRAADDAAFLKLFTKAFCRQRGLTASFMAQLAEAFPGISGHVHLSLHDRDTDRPLFWPETPEGPRAPSLDYFVGGLLELLPDATALVAHTVNSYRRLVPGNWAPRAATWGIGTYTTAVRAITSSPDSARIEFRVPAADTNPYLAIAFTLAAGLWGIENRIAPPEPVHPLNPSAGHAAAVSLPEDLSGALQRLTANPTLHDLFGNSFMDYFIHSRRAEIQAFRKHVSTFERQRYLEAL